MPGRNQPRSRRGRSAIARTAMNTNSTNGLGINNGGGMKKGGAHPSATGFMRSKPWQISVPAFKKNYAFKMNVSDISVEDGGGVGGDNHVGAADPKCPQGFDCSGIGGVAGCLIAGVDVSGATKYCCTTTFDGSGRCLDASMVCVDNTPNRKGYSKCLGDRAFPDCSAAVPKPKLYGNWYYQYNTCGALIDPTNPSAGTLQCHVSLSDTLAGIMPPPKPNTNFYLGTGMVDPKNSAGSWNTVECDQPDLSWNVLNFGGWGCCPPTCKTNPLTSSQGGLCNNTATELSTAPAQVWGDSDITNITMAATPEGVKARGFNVVSFDIEGVDSSLTAKTLLNAIQLYQAHGLLVIITLPGFGVKHYCQLNNEGTACTNKKTGSATTCSDDNNNKSACQSGDHGGKCSYNDDGTCSVDPTDTTSLSYKAMEWFTPEVAKATDYICLMYYGLINDTEKSSGAGSPHVVEASLKKWNTHTQKGVGNMTPEQIILGLSLGEPTSPETYLSPTILNLASGGVSRWANYGSIALPDPPSKKPTKCARAPVSYVCNDTTGICEPGDGDFINQSTCNTNCKVAEKTCVNNYTGACCKNGSNCAETSPPSCDFVCKDSLPGSKMDCSTCTGTCPEPTCKTN